MRAPRHALCAAIALAGASGATAVMAAAAIPPPAIVADYSRAFDHGDYPAAIELARRRMAAVPADVGAQLVLARAQAALGRFEAAYEGMRNVLAREPRNTAALYYVAILGDLYEAQERPSDAEVEYKAGLAAAPASLDLLIALGDLTRKGSRFEEAVGYYERAQRISPRNYDVLYGLGVSHSYQREFAPAIASFREALALDPSSAPGRLALGHALLQSGQAAAAVPELEKAAALEPRMLQAYYLLGRALTTLGRSQEAAAVFEKVKTLAQGQAPDAEAARQSADPLGQTRQPVPLPSPPSP